MAIFFRYKCQSQCLFEHASDMVCSTAVRAILLSCYPAILQRTVHQHIMLSQLDNTLPIVRTWDGHDVASSKSRPLRHVTIRFGHCKREIFPTPPTKSCRRKNSYQRML